MMPARKLGRLCQASGGRAAHRQASLGLAVSSNTPRHLSRANSNCASVGETGLEPATLVHQTSPIY